MNRPDFSRMYEIIRGILREKLGKALVVVFLFELIQSLFYMVAATPIAFLDSSSTSKIISFVFLVCACLASAVLFGSLVKIMTRISRNQTYSVAMLFDGFKNNAPKNILTAVPYVCAVMLAFVVILFGVSGHRQIFSEMISTNEISSSSIFVVGIFAAVFFVLAVLFVTPVLFTWNVLIDEPDLSVWNAVRKSLSIMLPNYFHFIGFNFYQCIKNVVVFILLVLINAKIPSRYFIISFISSFYVFVQQYTIMVKLFVSIPVYYYSYCVLNGLIQMPQSESDTTSETPSVVQEIDNVILRESASQLTSEVSLNNEDATSISDVTTENVISEDVRKDEELSDENSL